MKVEIITNPAVDIFLDLIRNSQDQLLASPFIKANVAGMILQNKHPDAKTSLLTSYRLNNFHRNSSDLTALKSFIENRISVRNYPRLHAKTYIFDSRHAIITSANLTLGGLQANYECGVLISDSDIVSRLRSDFMQVFNNEDKVSCVTDEIISTTEDILSKIPKEKKAKFEKSESELFSKIDYDPVDDLYDGGVSTISDSLSGWRLDIFNLILKIQTNVFKLDEVYAYKQNLQKLHPENRNIEAKIRQQLQELRDLGLIEFLGSGVYRKLWKDT